GADPKPARGSQEELGDDKRHLFPRERTPTLRGVKTRTPAGASPSCGRSSILRRAPRSSPDLCAVARDDSARAAFVPRRGEKDGDRAGRSTHGGVEPVPCVSIEVVPHEWVDAGAARR